MDNNLVLDISKILESRNVNAFSLDARSLDASKLVKIEVPANKHNEQTLDSCRDEIRTYLGKVIPGQLMIDITERDNCG